MSVEFQSGFSEKLSSFVMQKNNVGFPYTGSLKYLREFDRMCSEQFPGQCALTKEICMQFAVRRDTEQNNSFNNRLMPIREFAKYLIRTGEDAYLISAEFVKHKPHRTPYIYSQKEILSIWDYYDNRKPTHKAPVKHLVMSAIIRLLYCCGLRPVESVRLRVQDVNLTTGKLYIIESKGHKDRIVMMPDDLISYLQEYDRQVRFYMPDRKIFFPNAIDGLYSVIELDRIFRDARQSCGIIGNSMTTPRLYDIRHTFATHRLYQWMKEGKDLSAMVPYLSAYMGHTELSDTYYYIHLVPGQFEAMSGYHGSSLEKLIPEVKYHE